MATDRATALHQAAIVVDAHSDVFCDVAVRRLRGETRVLASQHLPAWRAGGVNVVVTTLYVEEEHKPDRALRRAMTLLGAGLNDIDETPEVALCRTRGEIDAALARGQIALILAIEGGECVQDGIESLRVFAALGLRVFGLTWNQRNLLAEGVGDSRSNAGLTDLGRRMVLEANRLGVLVDVSHLTDASFWEVIATSRGPVIASHSNVRALCNHRRNLTDDQLRAIAASGGIIGLNLVVPFIDTDPQAATLARAVDHIDHIAKLVGVEHVALGPDFADYLVITSSIAGSILYPPDLATIAALPSLTAELVRRGYTDEAIRGILGENFLRVLTTVAP